MKQYTEKELIKIKKDIEKSKEELSEHKGQYSYLKEEIKKQFGCNSVQELIDYLHNIETKNEKLQVEIDKLSERLTEELNEL